MKSLQLNHKNNLNLNYVVEFYTYLVKDIIIIIYG